MMALVGSHGSVARGREQLEARPGCRSPPKRWSATLRPSVVISLPMSKPRGNVHCSSNFPQWGSRDPALYIDMDGTGVPMVPAETEGRVGKIAGDRARTREAKLGSVFTRAVSTIKVAQFVTKLPQRTAEPSRRRRSSEYVSAMRLGKEAGVEPSGKWYSAMALPGSGTSPIIIFPEPRKSSISITRGNISGN